MITDYLIANNWDAKAPSVWIKAEAFEHIKAQYPSLRVLMIKHDLPDGVGTCYQIPNQVAETIFQKTRQPGFNPKSLEDFCNSKLGVTYPEAWLPNGFVPSWMEGYPSPISHECTSHSYMDYVEKRLTRKPPVKSKAEYYKRYIAGEFGNRLQVWRTFEEYVASGFSKPIGIRNLVADSPYCRYDIPERFVKVVRDEFIHKGCSPESMTFNEAAPDWDVLIQGEFIRMPTGLELYYSRVQRQMRIALREKSEYATGNHAIQILKHVMDPNSYEWCEYLLDAYPDHSIEFSTYQRFLGNIPGRNTLIWEVRQY